MAFDSKRGKTVLSGGHTMGESLYEVFEWDGNLWQDVGSLDTARDLHAMAFDSDRGVTVLFGGSHVIDDEDFLLGDTWEWDGQVWIERQVVGPDPAAFHVMAYDAARKVTVFHGKSETWEWDGLTWEQIPVQPPTTYGNMVYDSDRQVCVIHGNQQTWQYDGQAWTRLNTPVRPLGTYGPMAYDSARRAVVLYIDGETWEYLCDPACPPDLDGNGALDIFDFLAFVNLFYAADPAADCDKSGSLDLFDFLCFTNAFNEGC